MQKKGFPAIIRRCRRNPIGERISNGLNLVIQIYINFKFLKSIVVDFCYEISNKDGYLNMYVRMFKDLNLKIIRPFAYNVISIK